MTTPNTNPTATPATTTHDLGNNESVIAGIVDDGAGFLALTFTESKHFATYTGAAKWLARRGCLPNGKKAAS